MAGAYKPIIEVVYWTDMWWSSPAYTSSLAVAAVIEEVDHVEDATAIAPIEAVVLQNPQAL